MCQKNPQIDHNFNIRNHSIVFVVVFLARVKQIQPQLGIIEMTGLPVRNTHPNNPWDCYISPTWKTHKNQPKNVGKYIIPFVPWIDLKYPAAPRSLKESWLQWQTLLEPCVALVLLPFLKRKNSSPNWPTTFGWKATLTTLVVSVFLCWKTYIFSLLKMLSSWKRSLICQGLAGG